MGKRPVVIYGASGFSGRLVAEFLREFNVPFIAAGRNRGKIQEVLNRVPGIETADYEIAEVGGAVDELARLFTGAKVVCNTVGPLIYYGPKVIEASLKADAITSTSAESKHGSGRWQRNGARSLPRRDC